MTLIVNLYGGPSTGKSTTAAGLFHLLKTTGYKCELVTEYAKEAYYEETLPNLNRYYQICLFAEQFKRIQRLVGKVDIIITDSPLLLNNAYNTTNEVLRELVIQEYNKLDNLDIFLERVKPYQKYGRAQSESEARALDANILDILLSTHNVFHAYRATDDVHERIFGDFVTRFNEARSDISD